MGRRLPSGRVTFAFTDVVSSTRTFAEHGDAYVEAVQRLQQQVAQHTERHGGVVVNTEGDGAFLAFPSAQDAVDALVALMAEIDRAAERADGPALRLRAGAHTGNATPIGDDYFALPVHVAARVSSTAGAGQVFVSQAVIDDIGAVGELLGTYDLKDIAEPIHLWRIVGDDAPPRATPTRRTNVAVPRTTFVGREAELEALTQTLEPPGLVTLVGPGGLGKTRLASELALRQAELLPAGVWLVEIAPVTDPAEVTARTAEALGIPGAATSAAVIDELQRRGALLLVLDNCEHLVDACAELVADLLDGCPDLRLLCTSREALAVAGEQVVRLAPLATGTQPEGTGEAEALFIARAEAAGAVLTPSDLAAVTEVCRHLDGLPLALELAAARAGTVPLATLASALAAGDLELERRGGSERQRSLDALVEWSLRLLDDGERTALLALSVFPGRFSAAMADAVLARVPPATVGATGALTRQSLLDLDGDRYRMLGTTRDVARRHLIDAPGVRDAAKTALFAWSTKRAEAAPDAPLTSDEVQAIQAGLDWALQEQLPGSGVVMEQLVRWELARSRSATSVGLAARVVAGPDPTTADEILLHVMSLRLREGLGMEATGPVPVDQIARIVERARALGDPAVLSKAIAVQARMLDRAGLHHDSRQLLEEGLRLSAEHPEIDPSVTELDLGVSFHLTGDLELAEQHYRRALEVIPPSDINHGVTLANLGELLLDAGRLDDAAEQLRRAVHEAVGRPNLRVWATGLLVEVEARRGNGEVARALAAQAEGELGQVIEADASIASVADRMRSALAGLDDD